MEILRTLLSVPGNRLRMIEKARSLPADALVLDLEDSVPQTEKATAREMVSKALPGLALQGQQVFVRVNSLATGLIADDLEAVVGKSIDGINLPKADSEADIMMVDRLIGTIEERKGLQRGTVKLIPWIETARALTNVHSIARSSLRIIALLFGADDFTLDMGIERSLDETELAYPRAAIAIAARAARVLALDTPYTDFKDVEGLKRESAMARQLGFQGKFVIHPDQVDVVNSIFLPSAEEIARAEKIVAAFDKARAQGSAATSIDGVMIDTPVAERARRLLARTQLAPGALPTMNVGETRNRKDVK